MPLERDEELQADIGACARCGRDHHGLRFRLLDRPMEDGADAYTHWAPCPTNGQPVVLRVMPGAGKHG